MVLKEKKSTKIIIGNTVNKKDLDKLSKDSGKGKNKFDNYIIAYLDFLGFAEKMKEEESYESLQIMKLLFYGAKSIADNISCVNELNNFDIKIFSDNIVIAQKAEPKRIKDQIIGIVNLIGQIQFDALVYFGFLLRGGITYGELHIDNTIVWGAGLIDAYNIENNLANYPRVILSKQILKKYNLSRQESLNLHALIKEDADGLCFVDYFMASPNIKLIPKIAKVLKEIIKLYVHEPDRKKQKVNWIVNHFNAYCLRVKDRGNYEKYIIPFI